MRRKSLTVPLMVAVSFAHLVCGAAGWLGGRVHPDGWKIELWSDGVNTNGITTPGLGEFNDPGTAKVRLFVTSPGFTPNGSTTSVRRVVYATDAVRFPYPAATNNNGQDITVDGARAKHVLALSEDIYAEDSSVSITIEDGFYAQGGTNLPSATLSLTNASLHPWPRVIANWTEVPFRRLTNAVEAFRFVAFHASAADGKPVQGGMIIHTDGSTTVTSSVPSMAIDATVRHLVPFAEFTVPLAITGFTAHAELRSDLVVWPRLGTTNSMVDTRRNTYALPSPLLCAHTNLLDPNASYTDLVALVDEVNGNDTNGRVTNVSDPTAILAGHAFKTVAAAHVKLAATNNVRFAHNDTAGTITWVRAGTTNWMGGTFTTTNVNRCWARVVAYPGDTVRFTTRLTSQDSGDRVAFENCGFEFTASNVPFSSIDALWFRDCDWNSSATAPIQNCKTVYFTGGKVRQMAQGLRAFSSQNTAISLLRSVDLDGFNHPMVYYTIVGCSHPSTNGPAYTIANDSSSFGTPGPSGSIAFNNFFGGFGGNATCVGLNASIGQDAGGAAWIQNVVQYTTNNTSPNLLFACTDGRACTNMLIWDGVVDGKRAGFFYDSVGTASTNYKRSVNVSGMVLGIPGFKTDTFGTPSANRTGDWPVQWGVGWSGNIRIDYAIDQAYASFYQEFQGLWSYQSANVTNALNFMLWTNPKGFDGSASGTAGGGDYRLQSQSPGFRIRNRWKLPFDLAGVARGESDPPGPFVDGNARKTASFLGP